MHKLAVVVNVAVWTRHLVRASIGFCWGHYCCLKQMWDFFKQRTWHGLKITNAAVLTSLLQLASIRFCWRHNCCLQQTWDFSGQNTRRAFKIGLNFGMNLSHTWWLTIYCRYQTVRHTLSIQTGTIFFFFSSWYDDKARIMFWCFPNIVMMKTSEQKVQRRYTQKIFQTILKLRWHLIDT